MENKKIAVFGDSILKGVITVPNSGRIFDVVENDSLTQAQRVLNFELDNNSIYGNVITKAKGETYAGRIVAPVIGEAADVIIDHLGIARANAASVAHSGKIEISPTNSIKINSVVPNFMGMSKKELTPLLLRKDLRIKIEGSGWVVSQNPPAGTPITENMTIELYLQ